MRGHRGRVLLYGLFLRDRSLQGVHERGPVGGLRTRTPQAAPGDPAECFHLGGLRLCRWQHIQVHMVRCWLGRRAWLQRGRLLCVHHCCVDWFRQHGGTLEPFLPVGAHCGRSHLCYGFWGRALRNVLHHGPQQWLERLPLDLPQRNVQV